MRNLPTRQFWFLVGPLALVGSVICPVWCLHLRCIEFMYPPAHSPCDLRLSVSLEVHVYPLHEGSLAHMFSKRK